MFKTITIYCKNNNIYKEIPIGSSLMEIYEWVGAPLSFQPMNALVNNKTEGLDYRCWEPKDIEYIDYSQLSGQRTYVRSLCHIFSKAVNDVLPLATLNLEHSISKGYYCVIHDEKKIDEEVVGKIKDRMNELIKANLPFLLKKVRTEEAITLFRERGMDDKVRLIESIGMPYTIYYELDGYVNYFYGCLTPSTGFIQCFDLIPYLDGVLLRVPQKENPHLLEPIVQQDKMYQVYKEHLTLQRTLELENVGDLNLAIKNDKTSEVIMVSEAMQEKQVAKIAEEIASRYNDGVRIVLISGPSSSGKTTFCKRLQVQLITNLIHPVGLSLDDYFLNREDTPKDEFGEYDFESLYAIDLPYFNRDLQKLLAGEEIDMPTFDFGTGTRIY
ncbi:MAG: nucleoside kinase, partial [Parabacteroides sp.]|nr:nucleoside kinase [Parabacteroides sp.]